MLTFTLVKKCSLLAGLLLLPLLLLLLLLLLLSLLLLLLLLLSINRAVVTTISCIVLQVALFLRRIGLRRYADVMRSYHVDGTTLFLLDDEDYDNMGITNMVHIKKIKVRII